MEMGPQAEHDNDLGQEGAAVGASALLDTRPAHVLSPRENVRRRTKGPSNLPYWLLAPQQGIQKIQCLLGSNWKMLPKWLQH